MISTSRIADLRMHRNRLLRTPELVDIMALTALYVGGEVAAT